MSNPIDIMGTIELDALGAEHGTPRNISDVHIESDSCYRERLRIVMAASNPLQMPPMTLRDYFAAKAMASLTTVYWEVEEKYSGGDALIRNCVSDGRRHACGAR